MDYYDLIDTLVTVPDSKSYSGYLTNLPNAQVKYRPRGTFTLVTSQPTAARLKIEALVKKLYPNCVAVYQVNGTGAKAFVLRRLRADNYTDNDPQVRAAIANKLPDVKLYKITNGNKVEAN